MPKPKQPWTRKMLSSKTILFILLVVLILIIWAIVQNLSQQKVVGEQSQKLAQEIQDLEQQNLEFSQLIEHFASQEFIEREAREKLNLGKPGEKVIIVPQADNGALPGQLGEEDKNKNVRSSAFKWWEYFFKK